MHDAGQQEEAAPADAYTVAPLDTVMEVAKRANVRSGTGTDHAVIGSLDAGVGVRVTGKVQGREWLRVDLREDGGAAFIHASLLKEMTQEAPLEPFGPDWSIVTNQPCQVWNYGTGTKFEPFTWSGDCVDGKASGRGRWTHRGGDVYDGTMQAGKRHGHGTMTLPGGGGYEGEWRDGKPHGSETYIRTDGRRVYQGQWREGCFGGGAAAGWRSIRTQKPAASSSGTAPRSPTSPRPSPPPRGRRGRISSRHLRSPSALRGERDRGRWAFVRSAPLAMRSRTQARTTQAVTVVGVPG